MRVKTGVKNDSNHVPTSVDAYTVAALKEWFEDKDIATGLLLSLNKNRLTELGSNFTDFKKLGFRDSEIGCDSPGCGVTNT